MNSTPPYEIIDLMESEPALVVVTLIILCAFSIFVLLIIFGTIRRIAIAKSVERSRRDIAAYVAEGSISAQEGERLMTANPSKRICRPGQSRHT